MTQGKKNRRSPKTGKRRLPNGGCFAPSDDTASPTQPPKNYLIIGEFLWFSRSENRRVIMRQDINSLLI